MASKVRLLLWPADGYLARAGYLGVVAKKSRNRGSGPARTAAAGSVASGSANTLELAVPAVGTTSSYPGQRFGLPERGSGSVASMSRRVLALFIDWLLSMSIAYWLTRSQFWTIAVFTVEIYVLTALTGLTVGKRLVGIRAIRTTGGPIGFRWSLVRTAILLTVIPPLLTDRDLRGLHDRAADTIVIRL